MWKFQKFLATLIYVKWISGILEVKNCHFSTFWSSNLWFLSIFAFSNGWNLLTWPNLKFRATEIAKMTFLELLHSSKLISREIWMTEKYWIFYTVVIQGDPNQYFLFQMTVPLKICIFDTKLVKPKCVSEEVAFFNFWKFVYILQLFVYNFSNKILPLKDISALPKWVKNAPKL